MKTVSFWKPVKSKRKTRHKTVQFFKPTKTSKKNMNWKQAKKRYPRLNPLGDADRDGVKNWLDCKPFDKKRQGFLHRIKAKNGAGRFQAQSQTIMNKLARERAQREREREACYEMEKPTFSWNEKTKKN